MKNEQIARAAELGKNAVHNGIKAMYQCKETMAMLEGMQVGDSHGKEIMKAWTKAFGQEYAKKMFASI